MRYYYALLLFVVMLHMAPILNVFGRLPGGRTVYLVDTFTLIPIFMTLIYFPSRQKIGKYRFSVLDWSVIAFGAYSLLSILLYFQPNNPSDINAYFYGVHYFVLPIFCYFAVKMLALPEQEKLRRAILYLNLFALLFGLWVFYDRPAFYTAFLETTVFDFNVSEEWQSYSRLQSYFGSTAVGTICASSLVLATLNSNWKKVLPIAMPILLLSVALSRQRGGMLASLFAMGYILFLKRENISYRILISSVTLLLLLAALFLFDSRYTGTFEAVYQRSTSEMSEAFTARGYAPGLEYIQEFPLGVGIGGTSSAAYSAGLARMGQVVDANFMRIMADLGIFGLALFLFILFTACRLALKKEQGLGWVALIGTFCLVCLGTNTLDSHYISHLFYIFLGMIDSAPTVQAKKPLPQTLTPGETSSTLRQAHA
ncbi:MAG: O-antigen ligase family protein [Verrucomicrobiota bacterium]|nr:O-antigen ligase family protein [Verrucomicrobiota bacterium]